MKRNLSRSQRNMVKTSKNKKVNKGPSATWWPNFENVKKQKMDFFIILTTPENMKTVCATLKSQCSIVIFAKIAKNWPNFSFLAIILVPDQKNPNFLDFLDPYTCPDLGHQKKNVLFLFPNHPWKYENCVCNPIVTMLNCKICKNSPKLAWF